VLVLFLYTRFSAYLKCFDRFFVLCSNQVFHSVVLLGKLLEIFSVGTGGSERKRSDMTECCALIIDEMTGQIKFEGAAPETDCDRDGDDEDLDGFRFAGAASAEELLLLDLVEVSGVDVEFGPTAVPLQSDAEGLYRLASRSLQGDAHVALPSGWRIPDWRDNDNNDDRDSDDPPVQLLSDWDVTDWDGVPEEGDLDYTEVDEPD
jgi:hypothetical protein